ncbi:hypothetical protein MRB53_038284 [Persea americana]|nr:hypothetical protein MRB53_038284 [Persea americana]
MIRQLLELMHRRGHACPEDVYQKLEILFMPESPQPDLDDLLRIFFALFRMNANRYICYFIDGLDEMDKESILAVKSAFDSLLAGATKQKVFMASRTDVKKVVHLGLAREVCVSSDDTVDDVRAFINSRIRYNTRHFRRLSENENTITKIEDALCDKARGSFLWAQLQLDALWQSCHQDADITSALARLAEDLNMTYRRRVDSISPADKNLAKAAFRWLMTAARPLHIDELMEAVSLSLDDAQNHKGGANASSSLVAACANLIVIEETDSTVRLIHKSMEDFLRTTSSEFRYNQTRSAQLCGEEIINYLCTDWPNTQPPNPESSPRKAPSPTARSPSSGMFSKLMHSPNSKMNGIAVRVTSPTSPLSPTSPVNDGRAFLAYAQRYWPRHSRALTISTSPAAWEQMVQLALQSILSKPWTSTSIPTESRTHALLAYATREGHAPLLQIAVKELKRQGRNDVFDLPLVGNGLPVLHIAARLGFLEIFKALLPFCDVDKLAGPNLWSPLMYAVEKGHVSIASTLITDESLLHMIRSSGLAPLELAIAHDREPMVVFLLDATLAALKRLVEKQAASNLGPRGLLLMMHARTPQQIDKVLMYGIKSRSARVVRIALQLSVMNYAISATDDVGALPSASFIENPSDLNLMFADIKRAGRNCRDRAFAELHLQANAYAREFNSSKSIRSRTALSSLLGSQMAATTAIESGTLDGFARPLMETFSYADLRERMAPRLLLLVLAYPLSPAKSEGEFEAREQSTARLCPRSPRDFDIVEDLIGMATVVVNLYDFPGHAYLEALAAEGKVYLIFVRIPCDQMDLRAVSRGLAEVEQRQPLAHRGKRNVS